jgi:outer membrane receptor protein involved in Fe transport
MQMAPEEIRNTIIICAPKQERSKFIERPQGEVMRNKRLLTLMASASSLVLFATGAVAQQLAANQAETVVVTGSLVVKNGLQAPTPVTVVSADQLRNTSPSIVEGLQQLPQLGNSSSAFTPSQVSGAGNTTVSAENLRNLGTGRTLVLLDGRRTQPSASSGATDTSMFPELLIKRVDIVTGGASAVYGSDAVAGVINFVLDTDFTGVKAEVKGGVSGQDDGPLYGAAVAAGMSFSDGRGHIIVSGDFSGQSGVSGSNRDWNREGWSSFANPNTAHGQPVLLLRSGVTTVNATYGGIINAGSLKGTAFDNNGQPYKFAYAPVVSGNGSQQIGPGGAFIPYQISAGTTNEHLFTSVKYDFSDRVSAFLEGGYGVASATYPPLYTNEASSSKQYTIFSGNAYIPASVQAIMTANHIASFPLGRIDTNAPPLVVYSYNDTISVDGGVNVKLWGDWELDSYFQHGDNLLHFGGMNDTIRENQFNAADAVVNPSTGAIICRSSLTNPANGCVPIDPFGTAPLTGAQSAYVKATNSARSFTQQEVASTTAHGTLFQGWAGDVSGAVGFTYRHDSAGVTVDPLSDAIETCTGIRGCPAAIIGTAGGYTSVNAQPSAGAFDVKEGFMELLVPLARDLPFMQTLDLDTAVRYAEYSSSGDATTWKVGLTYQPLDQVRFRASMSRDLRAPNVSELFGGQTHTQGSLVDPFNNNENLQSVSQYMGSNPALKPETAITSTAGIVYMPEWLSGFSTSADYYHIAISGAVSTLSGQSTVNGCFQGNAYLCAQINRDANNQIISVATYKLNLGSLKTTGVDFESDYTTPFLDGNLFVRLLGTYLGDMTTITPGATPIQGAGYTSSPQWQTNLTANYSEGPWSFIANERFIGAVKRVEPPQTIDLNDTPDAEYTNLTIKYSLEGKLFGNPELYLTVSNLFDQNPRITATNGGSGASYVQTSALYDEIGRYFTVGIRANL